MEQRYWWEHEEKTRVNRLNEKRSLILWGLERPFEKLIFLLDFCGFPNCLDVGKGRKLPYAAYKEFGKFKCLATGLDASLSFLSTSRRCSLNRSPNRLPVYNFLQ